MSFVLTLALLQQVYAQSKTVSGTVTDQATKQGLPGVAVIVKGTVIGTTTGPDGSYTISVPAGSNTLVFKYIGYLGAEREIGNASTLNVLLTTDDKVLNEVVVTGYATQKREEFTGAASTVTGEAIQDRPVQSFAQALTGKAAGVNIVQPNGLMNNPPIIRVRGVNSISLSSFPLIVIDGIPVSTSNVGDGYAANNPLADINPADIESIDILKDAASTSIYGSRAANGVLIITTKKGKQGKASVSYNGWFGVNEATRLPDMLNTEQYMEIKNEARRNAGQAEAFFPSYDASGNLIDTDWQKEVYRTALSHNHAFSVSGGTDKTTYYFSIGASEQEGFLKTNEFDRKSARLNLTHKVTDWFAMRGNVTYSNSLNSGIQSGSLPGSGFSSSGLGRLAVVLYPNVSPLNPDGSYNITSSNTMGPGANLLTHNYMNPVPLIDLNSNTSESNRVIANLGADFNIVKGLTFKTTYSLDRNRVEDNIFWNPLHGDGFYANGEAWNSHQRRNNWNWINTLQYQTTFADKHNLSVLVGSDAQETTRNYWWADRWDLADPGFNQFQADYLSNDAGGSIGKRVYEAYLTSLSYNYAGKYFISGNFRRDGNSALSPTMRWGNFGGASVGWLVSEEGFFQNSVVADVVSNFRLKASWGRVGNGNLSDDYGSYSLYTTGFYGEAPSLYFSQAGNTGLEWETSKQTNIGLDLGFLNNRITVEANYYNNNVDGLILNAPQAPSKGIPGNSIAMNIGSMYNRGFEFAASATPIDRGKFSWTTNFNFTTNKNEVTSLVDDDTPIIGVTSGLETTSITRVGESVGSIYVVKTGGVNPETGQRIFINSAGEKVQYSHPSVWTYLDGSPAAPVNGSHASAVYNALPTWYGGFTNNFKYGNFDLSLLFSYSGGNYIYNGTKAGLRDQRIWNNHTDMMDRWTSEGQQTDIPRVVYGDNISNGSAFAIDANVEKGDFLRLQNTVLGYRIPKQLFGNSGISGLRVYAQVDNAFLLTKYSGSDPEISSNGQSNTTPGVERNSVPQGRMYTFGLNLNF
ncbi:TonB-dependent receptor [Pontibacter korlensis]